MVLPRIIASTLLLLSAEARAADLTLTVSPRWHAAALNAPAAVLNEAGQTLRVTRLALLLSEAELVRADGSAVRLEGQYGFIDVEAGRLSWTLRNVPEGEFVGLGFCIGVPPETNHRDPGAWPAGHPLNPVENGLHWSWQGGYVFLAVEGRWHEGAATAGANERGFSYHLATDARLMPVGFHANYRIQGDTTIDLAFDLARVLGAQHLNADDASESTHSADGDALAEKMAKAVERAWFWLEVGPDLRAGRTGSSRTNGLPGGQALPSTTPYPFIVPSGFPQPSLPADNPLTVEGIALGEFLFSDARLSSNGTQSCASCHAPARAFSDSVALSTGATGAAGNRNAMPLCNLAWSPSYAWDGSQPRIRDQALAAWTNPVEMGADPTAVVKLLSTEANIASRFAVVFGSPEITAERITLALEQFLLAQISADSKFDRALRGDAQLTDEEKRGFELFATEYDPVRGKRGADCFHCHGGALFTDFSFKHNGLEPITNDEGRVRVTGKSTDAGKFKTPSLRNVAVTGPYMHDGRFATLEEVVAHYDHGVNRSDNLDPNLAKHPDAGLQLSATDQRALVAFLHTLADARFEAYSSPSQ